MLSPSPRRDALMGQTTRSRMWHAVGMPRRPLRMLHTADVHLDGDVGGGPEHQAAHRERSRRVLSRIVDRALADAVDVVLIAGDLFDHNRVPEATVAFVRDELARLYPRVI